MRWNIKYIPSIKRIHWSEPILEPWDKTFQNLQSTSIVWTFVSGPELKCNVMGKALKLYTLQMQMWLAAVSADDPAAPVWRAITRPFPRACSPFPSPPSFRQDSQTKLNFKTGGGVGGWERFAAICSQNNDTKNPKIWVAFGLVYVASWQH